MGQAMTRTHSAAPKGRASRFVTRVQVDETYGGPCASSAWGADSEREEPMLWTILIILVILWLLGLVSNIVGPIIHVLLVIALIVLIWQLISGRRAV